MSVPRAADSAEGAVARAPSLGKGLWWAAVPGGITGILCCLGPAVLALAGTMGAATAFALATSLYENWSWAFRLAGPAVTAGLAWWILRRRRACTRTGVRAAWKGIAAALAAGLATYTALYWTTTWLGNPAA